MAPPSAPPGPSPLEVASKIKTLKEIVQKDPRNLPAWIELGNLYFDSDQPKEAIEAYSKYLPPSPIIRISGRIWESCTDDSESLIAPLKEFRKAAQSDPKHINSRYNIGIVLLHDKQDVKRAIKAWKII